MAWFPLTNQNNNPLGRLLAGCQYEAKVRGRRYYSLTEVDWFIFFAMIKSTNQGRIESEYVAVLLALSYHINKSLWIAYDPDAVALATRKNSLEARYIVPVCTGGSLVCQLISQELIKCISHPAISTISRVTVGREPAEGISITYPYQSEVN